MGDAVNRPRHHHAQHGRRADGDLRRSRAGRSCPARLSGRAGDGAVVARKRHRAPGRHSPGAKSSPACRTSSRGSKASTAPPCISPAAWSIWPSPATSASRKVDIQAGAFPHCDGRPLGHQDVSDFHGRSVALRLVGMKASRGPFRDTVIGTYRGRDVELAVLHDAFAGAERGNGKARIGISAPPASKERRLCFEFGKVARDRLVPVLEARASPYDHSGPLQPLRSSSEPISGSHPRTIPRQDA